MIRYKCMLFSILISFLLFSGSSEVLIVLGSEASDDSVFTWFVDDDNIGGPWTGSIDYPYRCIQSAIDNASDGDTVFVYGGVYRELVRVDKVIDLIGENRDCTVIDGDFMGEPVRILSSNVSFQGFTVRNGINNGYSSGVNIFAFHVWVSDCIVEGNGCGFRLTFTDDVVVSDCVIRGNNAHSIYCIVSSNVSILNCSLYDNGDFDGSTTGGINIASESGRDTQSNITVRSCSIYDNALTGISVGNGGWGDVGFEDVVIEDNLIFNNSGDGVLVWTSEVLIRHNMIYDNKKNHTFDGGCSLHDCQGQVIIERNLFMGNDRAVYLLRSNGNVIRENNFIGNEIDVNFMYRYGFSNEWQGNYYDQQLIPGVKFFFGFMDNALYYPILDFELFTADEPNDL